MEEIEEIQNYINNLFNDKNYKYEKNTKNISLINYFNSIREVTKSKLNMFNPKIIPNVLSNDLCDYIIIESEKYAINNKKNIDDDGWTHNRHNAYPTTDLPINSIPSLKSIINNIVYYNIVPFLEKNYNINKYLLNLTDIFIVKYKSEEQNMLDKHRIIRILKSCNIII